MRWGICMYRMPIAPPIRRWEVGRRQLTRGRVRISRRRKASDWIYVSGYPALSR